MANVTIVSSKVVDVTDIKRIVVEHHMRWAKLSVAVNRGLMSAGDAMNCMIEADTKMENDLAKLLGIRKWDAE